MEKKILEKKIGGKIRKKRIALGYTQAFFCEQLQVKQSVISSIESGKTILSIARLYEISKILKTEIVYFLEPNSLDRAQIENKKLKITIGHLMTRNKILEDIILKHLDKNKWKK
jgi:transcriptional regulator with XRE-family HTH domain